LATASELKGKQSILKLGYEFRLVLPPDYTFSEGSVIQVKIAKARESIKIVLSGFGYVYEYGVSISPGLTAKKYVVSKIIEAVMRDFLTKSWV